MSRLMTGSLGRCSDLKCEHDAMNSESMDCIIFTVKDWNLQEAARLQKAYPQCSFHIFSKPEKMNDELIEKINPRYIFFPHWSWIIPDPILERWECVIFHLGDVPQGRGGSPLQNHIERKIYNTMISALRATREIDEGPVYCKRDFALYGAAEEMFLRITRTIFREIIPYILDNTPEPQKQLGEGSYFPRRKKEQSDFRNSSLVSLDDVFDLIRMLDAEGYPKAYFDFGAFRMTFGRAQRNFGKIVADVEITMLEDEDR